MPETNSFQGWQTEECIAVLGEVVGWLDAQFTSSRLAALLFPLERDSVLKSSERYRYIGAISTMQPHGDGMIRTCILRYSLGEKAEDLCGFSVSLHVAPSGDVFHIIEKTRTNVEGGGWVEKFENFYVDPFLTERGEFEAAAVRVLESVKPALRMKGIELSDRHPLVRSGVSRIKIVGPEATGLDR